MRTLRAFFLGRLLREKVMLLLFVALGTAMWLSNFANRAGAAWRAQRALLDDLKDQKQWLASQKTIEAGALKAVKDLDPARTLDETRLVSELSAMAGAENLKFVNDTPQTERSGQFAVHTVQITLTRADWEALKRFYLALQKRSPYLGLEQFSLVADRAHPEQLNASLRVSSVEIVR